MKEQVFLQPNSAIKVVSFDLWGTVVAINKEFTRQRTAFFFDALNCEKHGIGLGAFAAAFKNMKDATERHSEITGKHVSYETRIQTLCDNLHLTQPTPKALTSWQEKQSAIAQQYPAPLINNDIPELFSNIHDSGRKIAVMSNVGLVTSADCRSLLDIYALQVYIDYELFSDESGLAKPNPLFFEHLVELANCQPAEIVHFGDNEIADYQGAKEAGLSAICGSLNTEGIAILRNAMQL